MKIAITSTDSTLDGNVDPRFGRCACFLIVETDDLIFEAVENPNAALGGGAGIQSAQLMAEKGVKFVLTGNCGPNAYETLSAVGIGVVIGCSGGIRNVVEQFKAGQLNVTNEPNVADHFGMASTANPPQGQSGLPQQTPMPGGGMGMTRGQGMGQGQGGGQGMGRGQGGGQCMGRGQGRGMGRGRGGGGGMGRGRGGGGGSGMGQNR